MINDIELKQLDNFLKRMNSFRWKLHHKRYIYYTESLSLSAGAPLTLIKNDFISLKNVPYIRTQK